jgi:hypothetical protein
MTSPDVFKCTLDSKSRNCYTININGEIMCARCGWEEHEHGRRLEMLLNHDFEQHDGLSYINVAPPNRAKQLAKRINGGFSKESLDKIERIIKKEEMK